MKIIVSIASLDASNERIRAVLAEVPTDFVVPAAPAIEMARSAVVETSDLKYAGYTLNEDESELTLEISDEVLIKYMDVYVKIARAILPFVKPMVTLIGTLRDDVREIAQMLSERK